MDLVIVRLTLVAITIAWLATRRGRSKGPVNNDPRQSPLEDEKRLERARLQAVIGFFVCLILAVLTYDDVPESFTHIVFTATGCFAGASLFLSAWLGWIQGWRRGSSDG